ncbi:hypothetical protein Hanom_Chr05g00439771 [Helianthus anomalus]
MQYIHVFNHPYTKTKKSLDFYWCGDGGFPLPVTSFYVTNLPGGVSRMMLWRAFQPSGVMKDAYEAKKKDSRGTTLDLSGMRG